MIRDYLENEVVAKRKPFNKEYRIIRKDDQSERWVHGIGKLEFDPSGSPIEMLGTVQDITERKKREIALAVKFEEIDKLNKFMVGREVRMAELKKENEELRAKLDNKQATK
jgi:hypothetical protein